MSTPILKVLNRRTWTFERIGQRSQDHFDTHEAEMRTACEAGEVYWSVAHKFGCTPTQFVMEMDRRGIAINNSGPYTP